MTDAVSRYYPECGHPVNAGEPFCTACRLDAAQRLKQTELGESQARGDDESSANLRVEYPDKLSRGLLFVKWLLVIPAYIALFFYGLAVFITTFVSFWAILFTGRYPSGLFGFARGYLDFYARTVAYFPLLLSDRYPFDEYGASVGYDVEEPGQLSRWVLLLKLVSFLAGVVSSLAMIAVLVVTVAAIPAWFAILFLGRYPRGIFNFVVSVIRWIVRVTTWGFLMRDERSLFATTPGVQYLVGAGAAAAVIMTVALQTGPGFSAYNAYTTITDSGTGELDESLTTLKAGDCILVPGEVLFQVEKVEHVACSDDNAARVLNTVQVTGYTQYPGAAALDGIALDRCGAMYTGYLYPTEEGWKAGDRQIACLSECEELPFACLSD